MSKEKFNESYVTTVQNYTVCVTCDATRLQLVLWDTACRDEYEILRPLSYSESDAILLCFSIASPDSLVSVSKKWKSELLRFCKRVPVILVGCKLDLRSDFIALKQSQQKLEFVSEAKGIAAARSLKACCYLECSAKTGQGVKEVLQVAARESLRARETAYTWRFPHRKQLQHHCSAARRVRWATMHEASTLRRQSMKD